jgi:hypothetical protein
VQGISPWFEFVTHVKVIIRSENCRADGSVRRFLGILDIVSAGNSGRVEMPNLLDIVADQKGYLPSPASDLFDFQYSPYVLAVSTIAFKFSSAVSRPH